MAVTSVTIKGLPDGVVLSNTIVRPAVTFTWAGGVGSWDWEVIWDDDVTLGNGNGNRQIQTGNSASITTITTAPGADLGDLDSGTTWYMRARVWDTNDYANEVQNILLTGVLLNEIWTIDHDHTGGDFDLDYNGSTALAIPWNESNANLESTIEGLTGLTDVTVTGSTGAWVVEVNDPGAQSLVDLTGDGTNLTGGTSFTVATSQEGDNGGTLTLSFDGQGPTAAINATDDGSAINTELELFSNITAVTVTQNGPGDWDVEFTDPGNQDLTMMTANDAGLNQGSSAITEATAGDDGGPSSETIDVLLYDPIEDDRFLYHLANVGVAFHDTDEPGGGWGTGIGGTEGADGDARDDWDRFLYHIANVGVGFERDKPTAGWGPNTPQNDHPDGDNTRDFDRFLYHLANIDTTQPCPFLFGLSKTTGEYGDTIILSGQGLVSGDDPTDVWDAEVRLYESASHAAAFVVMPTVTWVAGESLDTISVTIPTGSSSGFVAVVHTTTPSCTGSNFFGLTVVAVPPDSEAGWWVEAWNLRNSAPILTPIFNVNSADFEMISSDIGSGSMTVPKDHPEISTILDRTTDPETQTLLKIYQHGRFSYAFIPRDIDESYDEDGASTSRLYGDGQEVMLKWGRCLWKDHPKQPSSTRTWLYGSTENAASWGDMEPTNVLTNPGGEDAEREPWINVGSATISAASDEVHSGAWAIKVVPAALDAGVEQEFTGRMLKDGFNDVWFKVNNIGGTYTIETLDDEDNVLDTTVVVPGSTAWTKHTQVFTAPTDSQLRLRVTQTAGTLHTFWIDDTTAFVDIPTSFNENDCDVQLSRDEVAAGEHSLKLACAAGGDAAFKGVTGFFSTTPAQDYTLQVSVAGVTGETMRLAVRLGGVLTTVEHVITAAAFDTISVSGTAGDDETTSRFAWNSLESGAMTFYVDAFSITPGSPRANPGAIITDVVTAMQARGTLDFVQLGFTLTDDSKGVPWIEDLAFEVDPEWTVWDLIEKFVGFGYGTEFTPVNWRGGGDTGWVLHLYNPNTIGEDWTNVPTGPSIIPGDTVESAKPSAAPPASTIVYGEGDGGIWSVAEAPAATVTALERREDFVTNRAAKDNTTLFRAVTHRLNVSVTRGAQATVQVTDAGDPLPFLHFLTSDQLRAHLPQTEDFDRDIVTEDTYLVAAVSANLTAGGVQQAYELDLGRYQLIAERIRDLVISRMLGRGTTENFQPGTGSVSQGGSSGSGSTASAASGTPAVIAEHSHTWPEIQPAAAGGDLGGSYPDPSVTGLRGIPLSSVPLSEGQVYTFDSATQTLIPGTGGGGGGGGGTPAFWFAETEDTAWTTTGTVTVMTTAAYVLPAGDFMMHARLQVKDPTAGTFLIEQNINSGGWASIDALYSVDTRGPEITGPHAQGGLHVSFPFSSAGASTEFRIRASSEGGTLAGGVTSDERFSSRITVVQILGFNAEPAAYVNPIDVPPAVPHAENEEFDGSIGGFTVVTGSVGTVTHESPTGTPLYDLTTRPGMVLFQTDASETFEMRKTFTLADGQVAVAKVGMAMRHSTDLSEAIGLSVTDSATGFNAGANVIGYALEKDGTAANLRSDTQFAAGGGMTGSATLTGMKGAETVYVMLERKGTTVRMWTSFDGNAWNFVGNSGGSAYGTGTWYLWVFCTTPNAGSTALDPVGWCEWFRIGENVYDPWPFLTPAIGSISGDVPGWVKHLANADDAPAFEADFDAYTLVEDASPNVTIQHKRGLLSVHNPGGDASGELHALMWDWTPGAVDFYIEAAFRSVAVESNYLVAGLVAADGDTYGAGTQVGGLPTFADSALHSAIENVLLYRYTNYNNVVASGSATPFHLTGPNVYLRMVYTDSTDNWRLDVSPDGVSWLVHSGSVTQVLAATKVGFALSTWTGSNPVVFSAEYVRGYFGAP